MGVEILNTNYNQFVSMLGTAHFTRRSLLEAHETVREMKPTDLAVELDMRRYLFLNRRCINCEERSSCRGRCEFIGATDALGNANANIWLIDMSEDEIAKRVHQLMPPPFETRWFSFVGFPFGYRNDDEISLWENGYKDEVLKRHTRRLQFLRAKAPHVWRVLIDERNALMAARLAWIVTQRLEKNKAVKVLALTGAAHVSGVRNLLNSPVLIKEEMQRLGLRFTAPKLIRRVNVN